MLEQLQEVCEQYLDGLIDQNELFGAMIAIMAKCSDQKQWEELATAIRG